METEGLQLEMRFGEEEGNPFRENLHSGDFSLLIEINTPSRKTAFNTAISRYADMEFTASKTDFIPLFFAFTDKLEAFDAWNVADFAAGLCKEQRERHLIYISGRNTTLEEQKQTLSLCRNYGFQNIVPVSGDALPGEDAQKTSKRTFTESVHLLKQIQMQNDKAPFYHGCACNPFKYTPTDTFQQYFKLIKKINLSAEFIVTQAGWDMMKLQELRWYLDTHGLHHPTVARLIFLSPEKVNMILKGKIPGVRISADFGKILEAEIKYSHKQFESAQLRRLQLQAAGAKLLGYSGVQIAGVETAGQLNAVSRKISEALEEFTKFEDWKDAYTEYLARTEMAPFPHRFYVYSNLFSRALMDSSPKMTNTKMPECTGKDKLHYKMCRFLFCYADTQPSSEHMFTKKLFADCKGCSYCRLPLTQYICPEKCPKGMANGPCGGSRADGTCEMGHNECVHAHITRRAIWLNQIHRLEDEYIAPAT